MSGKKNDVDVGQVGYTACLSVSGLLDINIYDFQNKYFVRYFWILNFLDVLFLHLAEPSEEAGGDENRRRQKTNHAVVHRSAGHRVEKDAFSDFHWWPVHRYLQDD